MANRIGCALCNDSGKVRGGGMVDVPCDHGYIIENCEHCGGSGKISYKLDKQSEHYQKAKNDIMKTDEMITEDDAEKMLDKEISETKNKRGKIK